MPDAPAPTVLLTFALAPASWEAAQASVTGAEPPAGPPEFSAVDVAVGAETLRLEGPGATLERGRSSFVVGRRVAFPDLGPGPDGVPIEAGLDDLHGAAFLGLMRHYGWPATAGTAALRALYESDGPIPVGALEAMAAGGPEPTPDPAPGREDGPLTDEATPADGAEPEVETVQPEAPAEHANPAEEHA